MKKITLLVSLYFCSLMSAQHVATIDMDKAFTHYYKTIASEKSLNKQVELIKEQVTQMNTRYNKATADLQELMKESTSILLSESAREKKKIEAQNKESEIKTIGIALQTFSKEKKLDIENQQKNTRDEIVNEIKKVVELIAKTKNTELVLDTSGKTSNLISAVIYIQSNRDITEDVLKVLNKGHEAEVEAYMKDISHPSK